MDELPEATSDVCDQLGARVIVLPFQFRDFGARRAFRGPAATLRTNDDNQKVRAVLQTPGEGRVLVVDNQGSLRVAMVGGNLGKLAEANGWAGVVVLGAVRDAVELAGCDVGIKALGACPRKSVQRGLGDVAAVLEGDGWRVAPGDRVVADVDGVVVVPSAENPTA